MIYSICTNGFECIIDGKDIFVVNLIRNLSGEVKKKQCQLIREVMKRIAHMFSAILIFGGKLASFRFVGSEK